MIYFNSAATSFPKPACVIDAYTRSINALPSAQFRSAGIFDNSDLFLQTKKRLGEILGILDYNRIIFTSGSTEALNRIFFGLGYEADEYLTTATEHNSVLRPLFNLTKSKQPVIVPCDKDGIVSLRELRAHLTERTKVLVVNHCSNVTGAIQDLAAFGAFAREQGLLFVVDASQSAGCIELHAQEWGIDALAFTGHKSLLGVQGTGGYYVREGIELKPLLYGGSGRDSSRITYEPGTYEYEVGTQNSYGIAAFNAAAGYVLQKGIASIHRREMELADYLIKRLHTLSFVHIYGDTLKERGPLVSMSIEGISPADVAYILQSNDEIITRAGLQCAPLIHACIGSGEKGTLRVSFSDETSEEQIDQLVGAIERIGAALKG